jgi:Na+-driven multidrug efflux pump
MLGQGASTHVSHQLGAGQLREAGASLSTGLVINDVASTFMVSAYKHWGHMFTSNSNILRLNIIGLWGAPRERAPGQWHSH